MDRPTYDALKLIIGYLKLVHTDHGFDQELNKVIGWMQEIEKEVN